MWLLVVVLNSVIVNPISCDIFHNNGSAAHRYAVHSRYLAINQRDDDTGEAQHLARLAK